MERPDQLPPESRRQPGSARWRRFFAPAVSAAFACAATLQGHPATAASEATGHVRGEVVVWTTQAPISGATIWLPDYGATTTSGPDGAFRFPRALPTDHPYRRIRAVVTAPGWGAWSVTGVPLYDGDTLELHAELRHHSYSHAVLTPAERLRLSARDGGSAPVATSSYSSTCTGWAYQLVPPPTIKVWMTNDQVSRQYYFLFYVKHVLPDEWMPSWDADSLGSGAVAVRTFAHYRTLAGHAYSGGTGCADITDSSNDQVFDPTWSDGRTDQAVNATFGSILYRDNGIFPSQYFTGKSGDPCQGTTSGTYAGKLSQWGSETCATKGVLWPDILTKYYSSGAHPTTWNYLHNLLLNPTATADASYAWWATADTVFSRVNATAYDDSWYFQVAPASAGKTARIWQERPFNGKDSTAYHGAVALRCGVKNKTSCSISLKMTAVSDKGVEVVRSTTVTEPRDGTWRLYRYDPPSAGMAHSEIRFAFFCGQPFGVDAAFLGGPFGGS